MTNPEPGDRVRTANGRLGNIVKIVGNQATLNLHETPTRQAMTVVTNAFTLVYEPTPEQIREGAIEVQAQWTVHTEQTRAGEEHGPLELKQIVRSSHRNGRTDFEVLE